LDQGTGVITPDWASVLLFPPIEARSQATPIREMLRIFTQTSNNLANQSVRGGVTNLYPPYAHKIAPSGFYDSLTSIYMRKQFGPEIAIVLK
jgi:hypothetical protein